MDEVKPDSKEKTKPCRIREFLIKWQGKSYWKCSWISEMRVSHRRVLVVLTSTILFPPLMCVWYQSSHNRE